MFKLYEVILIILAIILVVTGIGPMIALAFIILSVAISMLTPDKEDKKLRERMEREAAEEHKPSHSTRINQGHRTLDQL